MARCRCDAAPLLPITFWKENHPVNLISSLRCACALLLSALSVGMAQAADTHEGGPLSLIITYNAPPANRVALRKEMDGDGVRQFQRWQDEGILKDYRLLFNRFADSDNLDAVAILTFSSEAAAERWKKIEQLAPGGLNKRALALTTAIHTAPADLERGNHAAGAQSQTVFMLLPYETLVPAPDYLKYADGYVIPQFEGWIKEGLLASYGIYVNRYAAARPWSTLVLLEYRSDAALGRREAVVAKVRAKLKDNPDWRAISDSRKSVRNEKQLVLADRISPAAADK